MKQIHLAKSLSLPMDMVTQTCAVIARRGAGKTYTATKIAEQMLEAGAQVIVCDPVGNWYGLRLAADGSSDSKLPVYIFGGEFADVPISPDSGREVARLLATKPISAVLDVSRFRKNERIKFMTDFAEEFYHLKKSNRTAVHLFIEEAQVFIPQRVEGGEARMVGAFEDVVRLGRNFGIGITMVSQRPQSVNKQVLSQTEVLISLQITGPHERKAVEEWVSEHGEDRKLAGELPSLQRGEAFFWSPGWLRQFKRIQILPKRTYDASSTPTVGAAMARPVQLSPKDIESISTELKAAVDRAKEDDPKELKRRIAELERRPPVAAEPKIEYRDRPVLTPDQIERLEVALSKATTILGDVMAAIQSVKAAPVAKPAVATKTVPPKALASFAKPAAEIRANVQSSLPGPQQRIVDAIAWLEDIGIQEPEQTAVAFLAGYTTGGGAFNNPRGNLRQNGYVEYVSGDRIKLTDSGRAAANHADVPLDAEQLQSKVLERLPGPEQKILRVLLDVYPVELSNENCAAAAGYSNGGGAYNNPRGRLRTLGLIEYPSPGMVRAKDLLFLK